MIGGRTVVGLLLLAVVVVAPLELRAAGGVTLKVRRNFADLSSPEIARLRKGVHVMKKRGDDDPTSWRFQANMHGGGDPDNPLHNHCEHGTLQFLLWHRGYVYYFEKILADASGAPDAFTLPYWDWSEQRALPEAFRLPADNGNSLYDDTRSINDESLLPLSLVRDDLDQALEFLPYFHIPGSFSFDFDMGAHGGVHVMTGGNMRSVSTAARDPIFWLHHCNVDRQLDVWLNRRGGRVYPDGSDFLNTEFNYVDAQGNTVTHTARELLFSQDLGYKYDNVPSPPREAGPAPPLLVAAGAQPETILLATSHPPSVEAGEPVKLGFERKSITLTFAEEGENNLAAIAEAAPPSDAQRILVQLRDISFKQPPNFAYGVYLNLPENTEGEDQREPYRVGILQFFGAGHKHDDPGHPRRVFTRPYDVTKVMARLRSAGKLTTNKIEITLIPITPVPPRGAGAEASSEKFEQAANAADIRLDRIEVELIR